MRIPASEVLFTVPDRCPAEDDEADKKSVLAVHRCGSRNAMKRLMG